MSFFSFLVFKNLSYPNMTEWYSNFLAYNDSRNGKLPLADLENKNISIMNTIASAWLMFAMGLATDANVFLKVIRNIPLCLTGSLTQFIVMPVIGILFLQIMDFYVLGNNSSCLKLTLNYFNYKKHSRFFSLCRLLVVETQI